MYNVQVQVHIHVYTCTCTCTCTCTLYVHALLYSVHVHVMCTCTCMYYMYMYMYVQQSDRCLYLRLERAQTHNKSEGKTVTHIHCTLYIVHCTHVICSTAHWQLYKDTHVAHVYFMRWMRTSVATYMYMYTHYAATHTCTCMYVSVYLHTQIVMCYGGGTWHNHYVL